MRNIDAAFKLAAANYQSFEDILDKQAASSQYSIQELRDALADWIDYTRAYAVENNSVDVETLIDTADRCHKALQKQYPNQADVKSLSTTEDHTVDA